MSFTWLQSQLKFHLSETGYAPGYFEFQFFRSFHFVKIQPQNCTRKAYILLQWVLIRRLDLEVIEVQRSASVASFECCQIFGFSPFHPALDDAAFQQIHFVSDPSLVVGPFVLLAFKVLERQKQAISDYFLVRQFLTLEAPIAYYQCLSVWRQIYHRIHFHYEMLLVLEGKCSFSLSCFELALSSDVHSILEVRCLQY